MKAGGGELGIEFRLLGPFEVAAGGRTIEIGSRKQRALLALLAVRLNQAVSVDSLAEELWAGNPPASVSTTIQSLVYRVRRILTDVGGETAGVGLRAQGQGYVLEADQLQVDVARFEQLTARGRDLAVTGAADAAARAFRDALALWRGPALADLADQDFARVEASRLEEARLSTTEELAETELSRGRPGEALGLLEPHVAVHPLRERAWGELMVALYRLGRQADALRAYQELRRVLGEELGLEPNPALRRLETQILQQSPELGDPAAIVPARDDADAYTAPMPAPNAATASAPPVPTEELPTGTLTILFTDVEGSTDLRTSRGDNAAHRILRGHEELVRFQLAEHGGHEVKALGDGFLAAFGSARRALDCAVAIQRALEEQRWMSPDEAVQVRMGLHAGEILQEAGDVYGQAVHAAARIAAKAKGGEILVSEVVRGLVGSSPGTTFRDAGRVRLKGFPERWRLYELVWAGSVAEAPQSPHRSPIIGREAELAELQHALEEALRGIGGLVLVAGEPGVGKTRLTEALAAEALRRRALVFVGRGYEAEGTAPYIPFTEILDAALNQAPSPEAFRATAGDDAPEIARLVPRLRRLFPDIPAPVELPGGQERRYLFHAVADLLARTAAAVPVVMLIEDLHWADESTLLLLEYLAERLPGQRVLVVGSYRDVEVDERPLLARTLEGLVRRRLVHQLRLGRLPEAGVAQMLEALTGGQPPPAPVVEVIFSETEGNPFFVEEVFTYLSEEGRLLDAAGRFRPGVEVGELDVPENVRLVIGRRLDRLSDETRQVLAAAAVVGRFFDYDLVERATTLPGDAVLDAVDQAERARLISAVPGGGGERFGFIHELVRQTVLTRLSTPRRRRLHRAVADALEQTLGRAIEDRAADLAHHLVEAGPAADPASAFRYLVLAGQRALRASAFDDALRHFQNALAREEAADPRQRAELSADLSRAHRSLGHWEQFIEAGRRSMEGFEQLGDQAAVATLCAESTYALAWSNRFEEAVETARRGLAAAGEQPIPARSLLLVMTGMATTCVGEYEAGAALLSQGLDLARELGDVGLQGTALGETACAEFIWMRHPAVVEAGLAAGRLCREGGVPWEGLNALGFAEVSLVHLGRFEEARVLGAEIEPQAAPLGHHPAILLHHRARGMREFFSMGDLDGLETFARVDLDLCQGSISAFASQSHTWLGVAEFLRGRWAEAEGHFRRGAETAIPGIFFGFGWSYLFQWLVYTGRRDEGLRLLAEHRDGIAKPGRQNFWGDWLALFVAVEGLSLLGQRDEAAELYPAVEAALGTGAVTGSYHDGRLILRMAAIAASAGAQWGRAEEHFQAALRQADLLPHPLEQAETRRWYGKMLLDRAGPADEVLAQRLLSEASDSYRRLRMPRHVALANEILTGDSPVA